MRDYVGIVSLDHDDTFSRDPEMFLDIAQTFTQRGYLVLCVTMRFNNEPFTFPMERQLENGKKFFIPAIYTGRLAKARYAERVGLNVDIWIDDSPDFLTANSALPANSLSWNEPRYDKLRTDAVTVRNILHNMQHYVLNNPTA